jgi:4-amino-4-deoxy-L-arabinose transferase-like glycosyltransferase
MPSSTEPHASPRGPSRGPPVAGLDRAAGDRLRRAVGRWRARASPWHAAVLGVVGLAAVLDLHRLGQNGYANVFYSAAIKSQLRSLHNFLFVSFDPGGLISLDKPPLAIWTQVASAKLFGFAPLSLLAPEAAIAILTVAFLYRIIGRRFGPAAGIASALVLCVFPSFVAVSRDNLPDPLMILFMLLACGALLQAVESGSVGWLLGSAVLVGLAFNSKGSAALLVVPGMALTYLVCDEARLPRRVAALFAAGAVLAIVSLCWIAFVDLTPKSQRPFIGDTAKNSEIELILGYNGFGRVAGQVGGPGQIPVVTGTPRPAAVGARHSHHGAPAIGFGGPSASPRRHTAAARTGVHPIPLHGRARSPSPFGGPTGPLRLFSVSLGGQGGWLLPFATCGLLAIALTVRGRRDPRLAGLLVLGGWFLVEAAVLSFSNGIVHPYYLSALGPGTAVMAGAGALALVELARRADWRRVLAPLAVAATVYAQYVLLRREHYLQSLLPVMITAGVIGAGVVVIRPRWALPAMLSVLAVLLIAPAAYSTTVWDVPTDGTFPAAGPHAAGGTGGIGVRPASDEALINYVRAHQPGSRWAVFTVASLTAAPLILLGVDAGALGGYNGTDPAVDGPDLGRLVARGEARYVWLGGIYSSRGGNRATRAVRQACREVPPALWRGPAVKSALVLYDCRGRGAQLAAA